MTSTGYAADNTLHLSGWTARTRGLTDQGRASIYASDTAFPLTGVNARRDAVGFATDHNGYGTSSCAADRAAASTAELSG